MLTACLLIALAAGPTGPDTVVVSPPGYLDALRPWVAHRAAQGHRFAFVSNAAYPEQIRAAIRQQARAGNLQYVVLIGDAEPAAQIDPTVMARSVPAHMATATVDVKWGSTPQFPTDNWYADLDDDGCPDVAIGRLPVDSVQELAFLVAKILEYESRSASGPWSRRINFVAGVGGFGRIIDPVLELATRKFLADGIPPAYETTMTYANWRSIFCPSPPQFHEAILQRLNEGSLFWVYIGHGYPYQLDRVRVPGRSYHILSTADMYKLDNRQSPPIAIFLACYTGAYDQPRDCLAEEMLRVPGGPVAVVAGARVMMPYGMAVFSNGLMEEYFEQQRETLGEVILHAKRRMVATDVHDTNRRLLDLMAAAISPDAGTLAAERQEHVELYNLLGDPLLRLPHPAPLAVSVPDMVTAGSYLEIQGDLPFAGTCFVELVARRDQPRISMPTRRRFDGTLEEQIAFNNVYLNANNRRWSARQIAAGRGPLTTALQVPRNARGSGHVCVYLQDDAENRLALGWADIEILSPTTESLPVEARLTDRNQAAGPSRASTRRQSPANSRVNSASRPSF